MNVDKIKLELFRVIDQLPEHQLDRLYHFLASENFKETDFWDGLKEWQKDDILAGIDDLDNGKKTDFDQFISNL